LFRTRITAASIPFLQHARAHACTHTQWLSRFLPPFRCCPCFDTHCVSHTTHANSLTFLPYRIFQPPP
jgi:hypothetical protein